MPETWSKPLILDVWVENDVLDGKGEYAHWSFAQRMQSRLYDFLTAYYDYTEEERQSYKVQDPEYAIQSVVSTQSSKYEADKTPEVIVDDDTYVMTISASAKVRGEITVDETKVMKCDTYLPVSNWDLEGRSQWVIREKEDNYVAMMSYVDYVYARAILDEGEDPFVHDWSEPVEEWTYLYQPEKVDEVYMEYTESEPPEGSYYFEPLQGYLYEGATVYRYEAPSAVATEGIVMDAALAMGSEYLDEMCSKSYVEGSDMDYNYMIYEYRHLSATVNNRMKKREYTSISISTNSSREHLYLGGLMGGYGVSGLAMTDTLWIVKFDVAAKVEGAGYTNMMNYQGEWMQSERGYFWDRSAILMQDGSTYYMVFQADVVPRMEVAVG